jgi:flavorubredoxin
MRTNIDIDENLLKEAMAATGTTTKKAAVEACLSEVVQLRQQSRVRKIFGIGGWRGHDDDWFASDEEILEKRRAEQAAQSNNVLPPATGQQSELIGELR